MKKRWLIAICLIFLLSFGLILKQLYPSLSTGDTPEFMVNSQTLGINHPAGYPLYSLLGKLLTLCPLSSPAFRLNLLSALSTALSASLLTLTLSLDTSLVLSIIIGCLLPLGIVIFSQSVAAEVYTLNLSLFSLLIYFLKKFQLTNGKHLIFLTIFTWILGLTNHYLILLAFPLFLLFIPFNGKVIIKSFFLLSLGFLVYLYLPLRANHLPPINWGSPSNFSTFLAHLSREEYRPLEFAQAIPLLDKGKYLVHFLKLNWLEFSPLIFLAGLLGLILGQRQKEKIILLTEYLLYSLGLIFMLHFPYRIQDTYRVTVYYLPAFFIGLIFSSWGLELIWEKLSRQSYLKYAFLLILFMPLYRYFNYSATRLNFLVTDYITNLALTAPANFQIVTEGDNETFGLFYLKFVAGNRQDLEIYNLMEKALRTKSPFNEPNLIAYTNQRNAQEKFYPLGLLYLSPQYSISPWRYYRERGFNLDYQRLENFERELLATFILAKRGNYNDKKNYFLAIKACQEAAKIGQEFAWVNNHTAVSLAQLSKNQEAIKLYRQALEDDSYYLEAYYNLGWLLKKQGDLTCLEVFQKYLELSADNPQEKPYREQVLFYLRSR